MVGGMKVELSVLVAVVYSAIMDARKGVKSKKK
jgi:hypothetical protein